MANCRRTKRNYVDLWLIYKKRAGNPRPYNNTLEKTGWIQARAARLLGITSRQIDYKVKKYGIEEKVL